MANSYEYKCPNCGGSVVFDSTTQKMTCPYCGTEFEPEVFGNVDDVILSDTPSEGMSAQDYYTDGDNLCIYLCESCGGEIVTDKTTSATSCPFCGNAVVLQGNLSGGLKPDIVVPFSTTKEQAKEALRNFYKGKKLLPKAFNDENKIDEIKGVYVPFWLYSSNANASIRYKATKNRTWSDMLYIYNETSIYKVDRAGTLQFDDVPVDGSGKVLDSMMESIEPFDWSKAVDFKTAYLSGFFADKYDVSSDECFERAKERMTNSTTNAFSATVNGYDSVNKEQANIQYSNTKIKYGLLPVWMLSTSWNGNNYTFAMNGQTGKFTGSLPLDKTKARIYTAIIGGLVALGLYLIATFVL